MTGLGRWGTATWRSGLALDEMPYVMGLVRQSFEKQMGNGGGTRDGRIAAVPGVPGVGGGVVRQGAGRIVKVVRSRCLFREVDVRSSTGSEKHLSTSRATRTCGAEDWKGGFVRVVRRSQAVRTRRSRTESAEGPPGRCFPVPIRRGLLVLTIRCSDGFVRRRRLRISSMFCDRPSVAANCGRALKARRGILAPVYGRFLHNCASHAPPRASRPPSSGTSTPPTGAFAATSARSSKLIRLLEEQKRPSSTAPSPAASTRTCRSSPRAWSGWVTCLLNIGRVSRLKFEASVTSSLIACMQRPTMWTGGAKIPPSDWQYDRGREVFHLVEGKAFEPRAEDQ